MADDISADRIRSSVDRALEKAINGAPSPRLVPFTPAQMDFLKGLIAESLVDSLARPEADA